MKGKGIDITNLLTVKNYALKEGVTPQYIYKLTKQERMDLFEIDGVYFVEINRFPSLPVTNRR